MAFHNLTQYADQFVWNYGDGITETTTATDLTHIYTEPGTYTVTLTAYNAFGSGVVTKVGYVFVHAPSLASTYYVDALMRKFPKMERKVRPGKPFLMPSVVSQGQMWRFTWPLEIMILPWAKFSQW